MGLFSDKCPALIDPSTKRTLSGELQSPCMGLRRVAEGQRRKYILLTVNCVVL